MSGYRPGEIVDITIKGVRVITVEERDPCGHVVIDGDDGNRYAMPPQAKVERIAPAEWPPRAGDLWRSELGEMWFAVFDNYGLRLVMLPSNPTKGLTGYEPGRVLAVSGPLTLVHREEAGQ